MPELPRLTGKAPAQRRAPSRDSNQVAYDPTVKDVQGAIKSALETHSPNPLVMTYTGENKQTGEKTVKPYVTAPGMAVCKQEYANYRGGIAFATTIMVRSQHETPEVLAAVYSGLSEKAQELFMERRNNDFSCFTLPAGHSRAAAITIFGNGERWESVSEVHRENVDMSSLSGDYDALARTRATRQQAAQHLAAGFMPLDKYKPGEQRVAEKEAGTGFVDVGYEAADRFFASQLHGTSAFDGDASYTETEGGDTQDQTGEPGEAAPSGFSGSTGSQPEICGVRDSDGGDAPTIQDLLRLVRKTRHNLLDLCKNKYGHQEFKELTPAQRIWLGKHISAEIEA